MSSIAFNCFKGEHIVLGGILKDGTTPVTGEDMYARFTKTSGKYKTLVGEEKFETGQGGAYAILLDTAVYNGTLTMRVYIKAPSEYIVVGEQTVTINCRDL